MSKQKTFSAIKVTYPETLASSSKIHLMGSLTRWCCNHNGRVLSSIDNSFILTDLDGSYVAALLHIIEVGGGFSELRLISSTFFDGLFESKKGGEVA